MWDLYIDVCHDILTQLISRKELHWIIWEIMTYILLVHSICNSASSVHGACSTKDRISICPGSSWEILLSCSYPASNSCPTAWWSHSYTTATTGAGHTCLLHKEFVFCEQLAQALLSWISLLFISTSCGWIILSALNL